MEISTGSVIRVLGAPHDASPRYFEHLPAQRRADAWSWSCGCAAEPHTPGRFRVAACDLHSSAIAKRHQRLLARR